LEVIDNYFFELLYEANCFFELERLWLAFYFERWPRFKDDIAYKKSVSLDWMQLYIRMHTYSRDVLRLHTVSMNESVRTFMEETLISPCKPV
jgi:hypothetical protein